MEGPPPEVGRLNEAYHWVRIAAGELLWHFTGHDRRPDPPWRDDTAPLDPTHLTVTNDYEAAVEYVWLAVPSAPEEYVAEAAARLTAAVTGVAGAPAAAAALDDLRAALDTLATARAALHAADEQRRQARAAVTADGGRGPR